MEIQPAFPAWALSTLPAAGILYKLPEQILLLEVELNTHFPWEIVRGTRKYEVQSFLIGVLRKNSSKPNKPVLAVSIVRLAIILGGSLDEFTQKGFC